MKRKNQAYVLRCILSLLVIALLSLMGFAQTTAFTYQGKLTDAGNPANGSYDLQFRLFDALVGGNQVPSTATLIREDVAVSNGIFTVTLDFGAAAFPGASRFLEIGVRPGVSVGAFTSLSPLQPVSATPYAIKSLSAAAADSLSVTCVNCVTSSQIGSLPTNSGSYIQNQEASPQSSANFSISGNGTLGGVLTASVLKSNALRQELIANAPPNVINGFLGTGATGATPGNRVTSGVVGATIGGGGFNGTLVGSAGPSFYFDSGHRVTDFFGTVGGGVKNLAGNDDVTMDNAMFATVGGGANNIASGERATVGGGSNNRATGVAATVPGGDGNLASGNYSFAAGSNAFAEHQGSFVWSDGTSAFGSSGLNQFLIRATGGVGIGTNAPAQPLHVQHATDGFEARFGQSVSVHLDISGNQITSYSGSGGGSPLLLNTSNNGDIVLVAGGGKVGIGTPNISLYKLSVEGGDKGALLSRSNSVGSEAIRGEGPTGVVGVGEGRGVSGFSNSSLLTHAGVYGFNYAIGGVAVTGEQNTDTGTGVYGFTTHPNGFGVTGQNKAGGFAGYFYGKVNVTGNLNVGGTLTKAGGSFKIDHPLDPENKYLSHSFVESPDMKNLYDGTVTTDANGDAEVTLPDWFAALNRDFRYQLTCIGVFAQAIIAEEIKDNRFKIKTSLPNVKVSWQVTGTRQDAWANQNRVPVEELKPAIERGFYQNPTAFGQPEERGIEWARRPEQMRQMKEHRESSQSEQPQQSAAPAERPRQH